VIQTYVAHEAYPGLHLRGEAPEHTEI